MLLLTPILLVPVLAGLLCLVVRSPRVMAALGVLAFSATLGLGLALVQQVLARGVVTEWREFLSADALSAWMVLLISVVSLATSLYAGRYFRRDVAAGTVTPGRVREFFVLTPLFGAGMFLVVLANNLGVMWAAVEGTALSSVLLVALYNRRTSLEAAWKYVILGSLGLARSRPRPGTSSTSSSITRTTSGRSRSSSRRRSSISSILSTSATARTPTPRSTRLSTSPISRSSTPSRRIRTR